MPTSTRKASKAFQKEAGKEKEKNSTPSESPKKKLRRTRSSSDGAAPVETNEAPSTPTRRGRRRALSEDVTKTSIRRSPRRSRGVSFDQAPTVASDAKPRNTATKTSSTDSKPRANTPKTKVKKTTPRKTPSTASKKVNKPETPVPMEEDSRPTPISNKDDTVAVDVAVKASPSKSKKPKVKKTTPKKKSPKKTVSKQPKKLEESLPMEEDTEPPAKVSNDKSPTMDVQVHRLRHLDYIPSQILSMTQTVDNNEKNKGGYIALSRQDGSIDLVQLSAVDEYADGKKQMPHLFPLATIAGSERLVAHSLCWVTTPASATSLIPPCVAASPDGTLWTVHFSIPRTAPSSTPQPQLQSRITSGGGGVFDLCTCLGATAKGLGLVAGACQDGSIRIWQVSTSRGTLIETPLVVLPTAGSPVLSVAWRGIRQQQLDSVTTMYETVVYAGAADSTIRTYNLSFQMTTPEAVDKDASFHVVHQSTALRMTVETRGRRTSTKTWTMAVLQDGSLVTGNSLGQVQYWNTATGTLIQSINQTELKADVLKLVVNAKETKIFASGVDSRVVCLERSSPSDKNWKFATAQRPHTHDIKSMVLVEAGPSHRRLEALVTGGLDTKLCSYVVSEFSKKRPQVWYPWPCVSPISTSGAESRIMSVHRSNHIELYRLQNADVPTRQDASEMIAEIAIETSSNLTCSKLSDNGKWLAASNATTLFVFQLSMEPKTSDDESPTLAEPQKVVLPSNLERISAVALQFCGDTLFACDTGEKIHTVDLTNGTDAVEFSSVDIPSSTDREERLPIQAIETTVSGNYMISMSKNAKEGVHIFRKESKTYEHYWTLPSLSSRPAAVTAIGDSQIAVATASFRLHIFDLKEKKFSDWSEQKGFPIRKWPIELSNRKDFPVRLMVHPSKPTQLIMASFGAFVVVNLDGNLPKHCRMVPETHVRRRRKRVRPDSANSTFFTPQDEKYHGRAVLSDRNGKNCTICLHFNSMMHMDFLSSSEVVVVEQPWLRVISTFPDALQRRVYGVH